MSLAKLNKHSWKEYNYCYANDNTPPRRMWMRDDDRILEIKDNLFVTGNSSHIFDGTFNSFNEAEKMMNKAND